ncbi:MAG: trimethylamine methyltransferase family protein, partial [Alphaproteobacteria bacterium]|nr:trimethylamine methyltransferase family protein [Alphaproteobacteria bacterium]
MSRFMRPLEVTKDSLAVDAIKDVGSGGHFFGTAHTIERYETAFYAPLLSDWNNFETWAENGSLTATQRAHNLSKKIMNEYQAPSIELGAKEEINEFVNRRIQEGGATGDF